MDKQSSGEPYAQVLRKQLIQTGLEGVEIITIDSLTAQKRLIEAGFGVGLLPISSIQEELRLGALQILDIPVSVKDQCANCFIAPSEASPNLHFGDCFVAKSAPRNDRRAESYDKP